jgi:hypothetical protein
MAFGSGFERFEVAKTLQRWLYTLLKKIILIFFLLILGYACSSYTVYRRIACWKLKGLATTFSGEGECMLSMPADGC